MANETIQKNLIHYVFTFFSSAPARFLVTLVLMLSLGLLEGVGLLMLIPLLQIAGFHFAQALPLPLGLNHLLQSEHLSLLSVLGIYFVILNVFSILKYFRSVLGVVMRENFTRSMRQKLYQALVKAKYDFIAHQRDSDVLHVMTMETTRAGQAAHFFLDFLTTSFLIVVYVSFFLWLSPKLALVALVCSAGLFAVLRFLNKKSYNLGKKTFSSYQDFYQLMGHFFRCIKYSKQRNLQRQQLDQFNEVADSLAERQIIFSKLSSKTTWFYTAGSVLLVCLMFYGALSVLHLALADMLLLLAIYVRLLAKVSSSQRSFQNLSNMIPAFYAVKNLEAQARSEAEVEEVGAPLIFNDSIQFDSVSFAYNNAVILHDLKFKIKKDSLTLLVGPNGAGKTTLSDLLVGLLRPTSGSILIDGKPLKNVTAWQNQLAYVSQNALLYHLTVRENLLMSKPDADDDALWRALELTGVDSAVKNLPLGIDMPIHKAQLSGGETQKLALTRALLSYPTILVLDEAMSSLDQESRQSLAALLSRLKEHMTIFMITHNRLNELQADQVLYLEEGALVEGMEVADSLEYSAEIL